MSSVSLNTALTAMRAAQRGLDTASHNIANASNDGYTRQRVELANRPPNELAEGFVGSGVAVEEITRLRDAFVDARVRATGAELSDAQARAELLGRAEEVLDEPDLGITNELAELWAAFEEWSLRPAESGTRLQVIAALDSTAARVRDVAEGWQQLEADTNRRLATEVDDANRLLSHVAELNDEIVRASADGSPNDLLDNRDRAIDALSRKLGVDVRIEESGAARVSLNGLALVSGANANALELDPATATLSHPSGVELRPGGEIGGLRHFLTDADAGLPAWKERLDTFAESLHDALNAQHAAGYRPDGTAGGDLLTFDGAVGAANLTVAVSQTDELAAAEDPEADPNDGRNAEALGALRGGALDATMRDLVVDLGARVAGEQRRASTQQGLHETAQSARRNTHGVSLDEEMVALLNHQRSFQAASRAATAADEVLETLINRTGLVGR